MSRYSILYRWIACGSDELILDQAYFNAKNQLDAINQLLSDHQDNSRVVCIEGIRSYDN